MTLEDDVYGRTFMSAQTEMHIIEQNISSYINRGFDNEQDCDKFVADNHLDILVLSKMGKTFYRTTHLGDVIGQTDASNYYSQILYWDEQVGRIIKRNYWKPSKYETFRDARIVGESSDGVHQPLHYRDYTRPTGYYNHIKRAYNIAQPFPVYARATGRDTSHVYTLIEHIAGECAPYILAWLRQKMMNPLIKTEVMPIFVSTTQGTGKSTFVNEICAGLFGEQNVIASEQYDASARFNADHADKLVIGIEEKAQNDKRNEIGALKSRVTATRVRKESKGVDPIYQDSYTEYVMTTNDVVPIKFDAENQRRFMVMHSDETFTRKDSALASEIFDKIYGLSAQGIKIGKSFKEDEELIAQFKHELYQSESLAQINPQQFPKTDAYERCFSLPRTNDNVEIQTILRSLAPFIVESLKQKIRVEKIQDGDECYSLSDITPSYEGIFYDRAAKMIGLNQFLVFNDGETGRAYAHASVERAIVDAEKWLKDEFGLRMMPTTQPPKYGYPGVKGKYRFAPTYWFAFNEDLVQARDRTKYQSLMKELQSANAELANRTSTDNKLRVNGRWVTDPSGEFETVNNVKEGAVTRTIDNAVDFRYFLFESDSPVSKAITEKEKQRLTETTNAEEVFYERLEVQKSDIDVMIKKGIAQRVVYSGSKSYHVLVEMIDPPKTVEEYKWLHAYLCSTISKLDFDRACSDPLRLTRAPITFKRTSTYNGVELTGEQRLIYENKNNVYYVPWREIYASWQSRPLSPLESVKGRHLFPCKQEYKDAARALAEGTEFWVNDKYNGDRQRLFFPAYRILREAGFSHDELWSDNGVLEGIEGYYQPREIDYWRRRRNSNIIAQIDKEFDNVE